MTFNQRGINAYRNVNVSSAVPYADSVQLIQMLFDGLMTSLADAEGHFERNDIKGKHDAIGRSTKIIVGLQGALDFNQGGELATNLSDLYDYCVRRLLKANIRNDIDGIKEVRSLLNEIKGAWEEIPQLLNKDIPATMAS
ncbi:MAG: flagellar export chaperone FliS [Rhodobacteraceae bacterium]|jgi:flagellar protein FliS|nr:flagellar export chaperone FliS [Paracoccaceae bacterium]MDA7769256.1 flagellar export chaperone FliS [Porticoccaceae bacterium]MDG1783690.1 flagellar export chaperone FliS [Porticoccaceae bacterium]|tara:strand:- start:148 stop:567 length:420 start_codon:yes stop_codon:yes gene_type:complete